MSPFTIIVDSLRATLRPLAYFAVGVSLVMAMPDGVPGALAVGGSAEGSIASAVPQSAPPPAALASAPAVAVPAVRILTLAFDPDLLPASAFGDADDEQR